MIISKTSLANYINHPPQSSPYIRAEVFGQTFFMHQKILQEVCLANKYFVNFFPHEGLWNANIVDKSLAGFERQFISPVFYQKAMKNLLKLERFLTRSNINIQQIVHLVFPTQFNSSDRPIVLIAEQYGLMGGGFWRCFGIICAGLVLGALTGGAVAAIYGASIVKGAIIGGVIGGMAAATYALALEEKDKVLKKLKEVDNRIDGEISYCVGGAEEMIDKKDHYLILTDLNKLDDACKELVEEKEKIGDISNGSFSEIKEKKNKILKKIDSAIESVQEKKEKLKKVCAEAAENEHERIVREAEENITNGKKISEDTSRDSSQKISESQESFIAFSDEFDRKISESIHKIKEQMSNLETLKHSPSTFNENPDIGSRRNIHKIDDSIHSLKPELLKLEEEKERVTEILKDFQKQIAESRIDEIKLRSSVELNEEIREWLIDAATEVITEDDGLAIRKLLREERLDPNSICGSEISGGITLLHYAVKKGKVNAIKELLRAGANINAENSKEETPYDLAKKLGNLEIIEILKNGK